MRKNNKQLLHYIIKLVKEKGVDAFQSKEVLKREMQYKGRCEPHQPSYAMQNCKGIINHFVIRNTWESYREVFFFANMTEEEVREELDKIGYPWEGTTINSSYDCTGLWFNHASRFYVFPERVIVETWHMCDV
jgi:hypothetical protein